MRPMIPIVLVLFVASAMGQVAQAQGGPNAPSPSNLSVGPSLGQGGSGFAATNADPASYALTVAAPVAPSSTNIPVQPPATHLNPALDPGQSVVGAQGASVGNVTSADSLALAIFSANSAPNAELQCLRHTAGWGVPIFNKTGATRYDEDCVEEMERQTKHRECIGLATMYMELNDHVAAYAQLRECGGVGTSSGLGEEE